MTRYKYRIGDEWYVSMSEDDVPTKYDELVIEVNSGCHNPNPHRHGSLPCCSGLTRQDLAAVLPKNQCTQCGAWVSDELKDDHVCAAGEKKKTVFPEIIEGKDPDLIWRDGGTYVGVINRGDTIVMYTWDGIAESWITRNVFDRVDLFVKEF